MRQVVVYKGEGGYWITECPSLSGCISQGKTKEEAIANIKEAIEGYVVALEEDGLPVPEEALDGADKREAHILQPGLTRSSSDPASRCLSVRRASWSMPVADSITDH